MRKSRLAEAERLAASLEQATADLAWQAAQIVDRMQEHPPALDAAQMRHIRTAMKGLAARAEQLARTAAAAHRALYDNGLSLRLAPALDPAALEADRDPDDDAQPWASWQTLLDGSDDLLRRYPLSGVAGVPHGASAIGRGLSRPPQSPAARAFSPPPCSVWAAALRKLGEAVEPLRTQAADARER